MGVRQGRLVIVCGPPGGGKTTTARRLERAHACLRLSPDEWLLALGLDLVDAEARARVEGLQWNVAGQLIAIGQTVIIEWGTSRGERDALCEGARLVGAAAEIHVATAPLDVLWQRVQLRHSEPFLAAERALTHEQLEEASVAFEPPDSAELARYDVPLVG